MITEYLDTVVVDSDAKIRRQQILERQRSGPRKKDASVRMTGEKRRLILNALSMAVEETNTKRNLAEGACLVTEGIQAAAVGAADPADGED